MRRFFLPLAFALLAGGFLTASSGLAGQVAASLVTETMSLQPGQPLLVGVRLQHTDHWHTYWKNPGDSGLATSIIWTLPPGFSAGPILWPMPERLDLGPLTSYGYTGDVLLLTEITVPPGVKPGISVPLEASVRWLECSDICVPGQAKLSLELPVQITPPIPDVRTAGLFATMRARVPQSAPADAVRVVATATQWQVEFSSPLDNPAKVEFFSATDLDIEFAAPQLLKSLATANATDHRYQLTVTKGAQPGDHLSGTLVFTSPEKTVAWQFDVPLESTAVDSPSAGASTPSSPLSLGASLLFAFLGGLILNLMPCVLPVLSLKVLSFVGNAGQRRTKSFAQGLAFTAGVLVSFWTLAGVLLTLRAGGQQLGWGFQLQQPLFVVLLSAFLFLFGLNLLGVFEIGTSLIGLAGVSGKKSGAGGSFLSGVLATVVATPCTAPFMGSALGVALGQTPVTALLIFTALAMGMASPYLLLSAKPELLRFVPKPGNWMVALKQFLGFLLFATVVWLIWVYGQQTGIDAVGLLLMGLLLMGLAGWIYGKWGGIPTSSRGQLIARGLAALLFAGGLWLPWTVPSPDASWEPYSAARLTELQSQKKPVFVDFTAAWCLSCQVNERIALRPQEVRKKFAEKGVVLMKADWTKQDPAITKALTAFGRSGVPLYVLYGPDPQQSPHLLPEVITPSIVLEALSQLP